MRDIIGTRTKPSRKRPLKLPYPLNRHSSATDDIGSQSFELKESSLSSPGNYKFISQSRYWVLLKLDILLGPCNGSYLTDAKSEGDDPDCKLQDISVLVAEKYMKKTSFNLDIPIPASKAKEKLRHRKRKADNN